MTSSDPSPAVLVIDDDQSFAYLIERYGHLSGCRVISTPTLDTARLLIKSEQPALVMIQVGTPGQDGWSIVRMLKADDTTRMVPVAICGSAAELARMWEADADFWLSKPVMYDDFRAALVAMRVIDPHSQSVDAYSQSIELGTDEKV